MVSAPAPTLELSHLAPVVRSAALLPDEDRKRLIRKERWIGYPRARDLLEKLQELVNWPPRLRMPNLLIIGPTNNGKSKIIQKFLAGNDPRVQPEDRTVQPVAAVEMPPNPRTTSFYSAILEAVGAPFPTNRRTVDLEQHTLRVLRRMEIKVLIIDEIHNLLATSAVQQRQVLNQLKYLGNQLRIPLVGVGTADAWNALKNDAQLANRFEPVSLPLWTVSPELLSLLASFGQLLPLRQPSHLSDEAIARRVLQLTDGSIGEITTLMEAASILAIETGRECISLETINKARYVSPNERRMRAELEVA